MKNETNETVSRQGLSAAEVEESRRLHGSNLLSPPQRESVLKLFLEKFNDPMIRVLLVAALLSLGMAFVERNFTETIGIFVAILLATGVGFWFEYDAQKKFDMLNALDDDTAVRVIRDGAVVEIPKKEIVVGDLVLIENGEEIPADGVLLESMLLRVNESSLTGELSTAKGTDLSQGSDESTYPYNVVLRGTTVIEGSGLMEVKTVGDGTEMGKVAEAATAKSEEATPLTKQLDGLAKVISVVAFLVAALAFFLLVGRYLLNSEESFNPEQVALLLTLIASVTVALAGLWLPIVRGIRQTAKKPKRPKAWVFPVAGILLYGLTTGVLHYAAGISILSGEALLTIPQLAHLLHYFMLAVTLIVVAVPEGLPMSVTLSLALNMRRMLKNNNLVRKMHASETMGAINVICTDKTGTLTQNQMRCKSVDFAAADRPYILEGIAVNTTAHLESREGEPTKVIGNPTEGALLLWLTQQGADYRAEREAREIVDQLPFSTERKMMATLIRSVAEPGKKLLYIKGAPEVITAKCGALTAAERERIGTDLAGYQNEAMRTLALAMLEVPETAVECAPYLAQTNFRYLGMAAISDPVRKDVPAAIAACRSAGIEVKIITGDTSATAIAIARQVGVWDDAIHSKEPKTVDGRRRVYHLTGVEVAALSDEELTNVVPDLKIISRARPTDKERIVKALQRNRCVVAVTGDGTNDAPALNFAQVGLSMGTGTAVAKEASDITILDDSFASIVSAVMWGRSLYKNIQRFILFQLTINVIAILTVFIGAVMGKDNLLTITQMLWVNLIMDTFAALALASLPPSPSVLKEKPRPAGQFIVTPAMRKGILAGGLSITAVLLLFYGWMGSTGLFSPLKTGTLVFTLFVLFQLWNLFNAKRFGSGKSAFSGLAKDWSFIGVLAIILLGQILIVNFGGAMFNVTPLTLQEWIVLLAASSAVLWISEIAGAVNRRRRR